MSVREFVDEALKVSKRFPWIKRSTIEETTVWASIRLWLNDSFVEIFYRQRTGNMSYAYIEKRKRIFGANNMRIGWHLHPFERVEEHKPIEPLSIEKFLQMLEDELKKRKKVGEERGRNLAEAVPLNERLRRRAPEGWDSAKVIREWRLRR